MFTGETVAAFLEHRDRYQTTINAYHQGGASAPTSNPPGASWSSFSHGKVVTRCRTGLHFAQLRRMLSPFSKEIWSW